MRLIVLTALSSALILSVPAAAKTQGQSDSQQAAAAKPAAEKKICKRIPVSGSNLVERVCLTKEDWKKVEELN